MEGKISASVNESFFSRCVDVLNYGNYTWKNTFGKRGGGVLVVLFPNNG
jgi:hypothetical protein